MLKDSDVEQEEMCSLRGSLKHLANQSISQSGKSLARARLAGREYGGMTADRFFGNCYELRSKLVHGAKRQPRIAEVGQVNCELEAFVADLIMAGLVNPG